jgi:hypothetical protein
VDLGLATWDSCTPGARVVPPEPLFPRIEADEVTT